MRAFQLFLFSLCVLGGLSGESSAAPPAVTFLHPAGAQRGTSVEITASGTLDASTKFATSDKALSLEPTATAGKFKLSVAKHATPGTYWLRAHNAEGASAPRPFVVGALPDVTETEPNDEYRKAQQIERAAVVVNGKLEKSGDVDCFAVKLKKGETLVASLEAHHALRSPMDAMLQVLSADGFVLEENNDYRGLDPQLAFTAKADATYVVRVYAFPATPDASVRYFGSDACVYRLTLTTGPFADFAVPLALGPNRAGYEARGANVPKHTFVAPQRVQHEPFATLFQPDWGSAVRARIEPHDTPVWSNEPPGGGLLPVLRLPFSTTGFIEKRGESANIRFLAKKGNVISLHAESRSFGLTVNPVIALLDKDGKQLARAEPAKLNGDTSIAAFVLPADGEYTVAVSDLYNGGGTARDYFLLRVLSEPDYELSLTYERFTVLPGKPLHVPVTVTRFRAFADPIELSAEGLPEGVKAELLRDAKPSPNAATLVLTSEKPVSGAFRVLGTVKDKPQFARVARAPLADFETTADLWFTVLPDAKKK
jgi:hypothetical protein